MRCVADAKVRKLSGHRSEAMMEHYTHFDPAAFGDVKRIQESIARATLGAGGSDVDIGIAYDAV